LTQKKQGFPQDQKLYFSQRQPWFVAGVFFG